MFWDLGRWWAEGRDTMGCWRGGMISGLGGVLRRRWLYR